MLRKPWVRLRAVLSVVGATATYGWLLSVCHGQSKLRCAVGGKYLLGFRAVGHKKNMDFLSWLSGIESD